MKAWPLFHSTTIDNESEIRRSQKCQATRSRDLVERACREIEKRGRRESTFIYSFTCSARRAQPTATDTALTRVLF